MDGEAVRITCLDGTAESPPKEAREIHLDSTAYAEEGILFGGYYSYCRGINEEYYGWIKDPEAFATIPEQFVTDGAVFGRDSRVLTADELASLRFTPIGTADDSVTDLLELLADNPAAFYAGKSVVMVYLSENSLCRHTVTEVAVSEGKIHVTLTRSGEGAPEAEGERFVLIPVEDPRGDLLGAEVSFTVRDE